MSGSTTPQPSPMSQVVSEWGTVAVSVLVMAVYLVAMTYAYISKNSEMLSMIIQAAIVNATTVVSYWVGSSRGSSKKTDLMAQPPATQAPIHQATTGTPTP